METELKEIRIQKIIEYLYSSAYLSDVPILEEDYYPVFEKLYRFFEKDGICGLYFSIVSDYISEFISNNVDSECLNKNLFIEQMNDFIKYFNRVSEGSKIIEEDIVKLKCEIIDNDKVLKLTS